MHLRKSLPTVILAGLLSASAVTGCARQPTPPVEPANAQVTAVTLQSEPITLSRELPGRVHPSLIAEVRPQVGGIVQQRLFVEGGRVEAGQPLYQLDAATYQADLAIAEAALGRAQATLHSARLTAERIAELAATDAVSEQDNDQAVAALRQAEADVRSAEATVESRRILVEYARITAPISGRIGKSTVTQGALVSANQAAELATVQQLDPIYVDLRWSSRELLELRKELAAGTLNETDGMPVRILLEDGSAYHHQGHMTFADLTVDPGTGTFEMRVEVPNPDNLLLPGMYVRAIVSSGERRNALLVPQQGISRDAKGQASALVVGADNQVERRAVEVSRAVGDRWLVDGGLTPGDRVIVKGLQKVQPGMQVQVAEAAPAAAADQLAVRARTSVLPSAGK